MDKQYNDDAGTSSKFTFLADDVLRNIAKIRYWQVRVNHPRKSFIDTPKNRTELIQKHGAMFFSTPALSEPYDDSNPDKEIIRYDDFIWDFDNEKNPEKPLMDMLYVIQHLAEIYGIDPNCLNIYCSGKKGFHLIIPAECFGSQDGDMYLPKIYKRIACQIVESLELTTADVSIYNMKSGKPFRIAGIRRSNGRYKVPLTLDEVQSMDVEDLWALADSPRKVEIVEADTSCPDLEELYQEHKVAVYKEVQEEKDRPPADPEHMKRLNGQLAPCIIYILRGNPKTDKTTFNLLTMNLVKYFQGTGFTLDGALHLTDNFLQSYPHSTQYTTYQERLKHFREQWRYHEGHGSNTFSCSYIKGFGFPGSVFECKQCPLKCDKADSGNAGAECPLHDDEWDDPIPIQCELLPVEPFNPDLLPAALREWVVDIADRMRCPIDYPAIGAMVVFSSFVGKKLGIKPKKHDDWVVASNLWGCVIGRPSAKKTPALEQCLKQPFRLEIAAKAEHDLQNAEWAIDKNLSEMKADVAKKDALKSLKSGATEAAKKILSSVGDCDLLEPKRKRFVVNDTTVEKLGEILAENPNGVLIYRDELFGFLKTINREDRSNDRSFYLEAWNGLGRYSYDRIGRGTIDIESCIVSILGCLTPSKLIPMVSAAVDGGIDDDGLLQRFQLMVYPDQTPWSYVDRIPDKDARDTAFEFLKWVSEQAFPKNDEFSRIPVTIFSDDAQVLFIKWLSQLEREISSPDIHPAIESHLAKYRSLIPSIALLLHIGTGDEIGRIEVGELEKAIAWGKYLKSHALRIYGLAVNNKGRVAKLLLDKIKAGKLGNPFVIRDIKRVHWQGLMDDVSVDTALSVLVDHEYLRITRTPTGGKPKIEYHINPKISRNTPPDA